MHSPRSIAVGAIVGLISLLPSLPSSAHQPERGELGGSARQGWPVIMAAGDIAAPGEPSRGQRQTAALIGRRRFTALLPLGDTQYDDGLIGDYRASYDPTWGRFLKKTHPVPGNHEYHSDARGYFRYFGKRAHRTHGGYYSFDLGRWHLIALNSSHGGEPSQAQLRWLRRDLRRNLDRCELAYWHHPRFSSGTLHGSDPDMAPFWRALHAQGVDVVLNGHEHHYERFARSLPGGRPSANGIRGFVVGTGGNGGNSPFGDALRGSRKRIKGLGLIRMQLRASSYSWRFVRVDGTVADRGSTACHR
ncbi:MAG TPA: metallophosphoesterase [Actinomycetota bacterium]|nr:metallophosphoesterase [Actinomycetota bacterium]